MFCKSSSSPKDNSSAETAPSSPLRGESYDLSTWSFSDRLKKLAVVGGIAMSPHILCLLGGGGLVGGGFAVLNWCAHHSSEQKTSVALTRMPKIPDDCADFSEARSRQAATCLITAEPGFLRIIASKQREADRKEIKLAFLENSEDGRVAVVVCKEESLCPCSKPEAFEVGHKVDLAAPERFQGQHAILKALYGSE